MTVFLLVCDGFTYGIYDSMEKLFEENEFLSTKPGDYVVREWPMNTNKGHSKEYRPEVEVKVVW